MIVAIPIWQNRVAPVFETCTTIQVFDAVNHWRRICTLDVRGCPLSKRLKQLYKFQVNVLVCNGISLFVQHCLQAHSITVLNNQTGKVTEIKQNIHKQLKRTKGNKRKEV